MFRIIRETNIDFMGARKVALIISLALIVAGLVSLLAHGGPRYSVDFSGGRLVDLGFGSSDVVAADVRASLARIGLPDVEVQHYGADNLSEEGNGVILRFKDDQTLATTSGDAASPSAAIIEALEADNPGLSVDLRREESVGPKIGSELRGRAVQAILYALALILVYVGIRFEFIFALGAVVALFHDVFITLGLFSILNIEVSLPVVAALLTIAGYSINDTIVVFDRIRERRKGDQRRRIKEVINKSINQMLARTIIMSVTTLFSALALYLFGGAVIHDFALAIVIGVVIGTYSSIFVATALVYEILSARESAGKKPKKAAVAKAT